MTFPETDLFSRWFNTDFTQTVAVAAATPSYAPIEYIFMCFYILDIINASEVLIINKISLNKSEKNWEKNLKNKIKTKHADSAAAFCF